MLGGDEVGALVLDFGTSSTKIGFSGQDLPRILCPTSVGVTDKKYIVGDQQLNYRRDGMEITNPVENSTISDWDAIENIMSWSLNNMMKIDPREHPLLISEQSHCTPRQRQKMCELAFETFEAPAVFLSKCPVLAAFSHGRSTALVVESGAGITTCTPVYDGYALRKGTKKTTLAGNKLTDILQIMISSNRELAPRYLTRRKTVEQSESKAEFIVERLNFPKTTSSYHQFAMRDLANDIKHSVCRCSDSFFSTVSAAIIPNMSYELPDGSVLEVGPDRMIVPELFFQPHMMINNPPVQALLSNDFERFEGLQMMANTSINSCDVDIRRELIGNIVCVGGTSLLPGFTDRLQKQLRELSSQAFKVKVLPTNSNFERQFAVWIGGSILGSLGTFHQMWFSKSEYAEYGAQYVDRKCL